MEYVKQYRVYIVIAFITILIVIGLLKEPQQHQSILPVADYQEEPVEEVIYIYVDLKGAVEYPGVYKVERSSRLFQVVNLAGGLLENADSNAINLSVILGDQDVIYIPTIGEEYPSIIDQEEHNIGGVININTATIEQLQELPGIGPSTAQNIIDYRNENGSFETIEDIMKVSGIGESTFENIQESITT
jgi:competence protein ComEA